MKSQTIELIFILTAMTVMAARIRRAGDDDEDNDGSLDLSPKGGEQACKTKTGFEGICVNEGQCNEDHTILPGGFIDDSEIRAGNCPGKYDWCCTIDNVDPTNRTKTNSTPSFDGCSVGQYDACSWCVAIYRDGGNPHTKARSGLYCGGALVGNRAILTSAGCVLSARNQNVWIRVPSSAEPDRNYTVKTSIKHAQYNSGTRENDLALMILSEDVERTETDRKGACLGLRSPPGGDCVTAGFDDKDQLVLTKVRVTSESCSNRGSTYDVACGRSDDTCTVAYGSPVLCQFDKEKLIVTGVSRQTCVSGAVNLGSIAPSSSWIRDELTKIGLELSNFTIIY